MDFKKKIQLCVAVLGFSGCAAGADFQSYQAYRCEKITSQTALNLTVDDPIPEVDGKKLSGKAVVIPDKGTDLNDILKVVPRNFDRVLLVKIVEADADKTVKLGIGADWWFEAYCNGRIAGGTLRAGGNIAYPPAPTDHTVAFELKKGKNVVAILAQSGSIGKFTFAVKEMPIETPSSNISRRNEIEALLPSSAALRHGPWLIAPSVGTITVGVLTDGYVAGTGVEYRIAGTGKWQRKWDTLGGILRNDSDLHRITLKGLQPGKKYEYRILLASENKKFKALDTYTFTAVPDDNSKFSFFVTGDTQFSSAVRGRILQNYRKLTDQVDFQVSLGDLSNIFDDFDMMLFGGYLNYQGKEMYHNNPFVSVRGNHELRGVERSRWFSLLSADKERGFYSFTYGKTFFIVLDTGGDDTDMNLNSMTSDATAEYMAEQRQWLEKVVKSDAYRNAVYRIVLSHEAPHSHRVSGMNKVARFISEPLLKAATDPACPVHLWLTGHIHRYRRTIPGTTAAYSNAPCNAEDMSTGASYPFPIITVEGPGKNSCFASSATIVSIDAAGITVQSFDEKNRCFDHFLIDAQGKITEKNNPYKKEVLKLYR